MPVDVAPSSCRALRVGSTERCLVSWGLDARGFCKFHAPSSTPCRGTTKTGRPCRIKWNLDARGFCKFHAPGNTQCRGVAASTGARCRVAWDLDTRGFCEFHGEQAVPSEALRGLGDHLAATIHSRDGLACELAQLSLEEEKGGDEGGKEEDVGIPVVVVVLEEK